MPPRRTPDNDKPDPSHRRRNGEPEKEPTITPAEPSDPSAQQPGPCPLSYPPDAVLTTGQVAEWLGISTRSVARMPIKRVVLFSQRVRFLAGDVYTYLRGRSA